MGRCCAKDSQFRKQRKFRHISPATDQNSGKPPVESARTLKNLPCPAAFGYDYSSPDLWPLQTLSRYIIREPDV
jgi:hypothetical protein